MRYAILADIHSNATALMAVLEDADRRGGEEALQGVGGVPGDGVGVDRAAEGAAERGQVRERRGEIGRGAWDGDPRWRGGRPAEAARRRAPSGRASI